jgi:hypothetical protein
MSAVRKAVRFCYLCGQSRDGEAPVSVEHVLAKGLLTPPTPHPDCWPVTLKVHRACDAQEKQTGDNHLIALQQVYTNPPEDIPEIARSTVRNLLRPSRGEGNEHSEPVIDAELAMRSMWHTVRGMHAVLYGQPIPVNLKHLEFAPSAGFNTNMPLSRTDQINREYHTTRTVLAAVEGALRTDNWDGIRVWRGELKYSCVWHHPEGLDPNHAMCAWALQTPPTIHWALVARGQHLPWRGVYRFAVPPGASYVTDDSIAAVNTARTRQGIASLLQRVGQ